MTPCRRDGALGSGCGPREQGAPPNLRGDRPAHGKDSNASLHPVPSVRAPDSWSPQSLSGPVLCWERVWGIPGAPSSLPSGSSVSPLGFLSPTSGLPGVPLPGGPGCASGSCDRRRKLRRNNSTPAFSAGGDESSSLFPQLRGPQATSPPRTGGRRAKPRARRSPTSGSIQSSRVPGGGVTSLSRSWPLRPDTVPVAEPLAARPKAGVAAAVQVSHQSCARRMWGARRAGYSAPPGSPRRDGVRGTASGRVRAGAPGGGGGGGRELLPAPGARVRHHLALRLRQDWSDVAAPPPTPPPPPTTLPSRPAPPRRRSQCGAAASRERRPLKGNAAPFPRPGSTPGTPEAPPARAPRAACPGP